MDDNQIFEIYFTKYALTDGIQKHKARNTCIDGMLEDAENRNISYHEGNWYLTYQEAACKAEEMRLKAIKSLNKKLIKLQSLSFKK